MVYWAGEVVFPIMEVSIGWENITMWHMPYSMGGGAVQAERVFCKDVFANMMIGTEWETWHICDALQWEHFELEMKMGQSFWIRWGIKHEDDMDNNMTMW